MIYNSILANEPSRNRHNQPHSSNKENLLHITLTFNVLNKKYVWLNPFAFSIHNSSKKNEVRFLDN